MADPAHQEFPRKSKKREKRNDRKDGVGGDREPHEDSATSASQGRVPRAPRGFLFVDLHRACSDGPLVIRYVEALSATELQLTASASSEGPL